MKRFKRILYNSYLKILIKVSPTRYAQRIGVKIGENNRIAYRHGMFGTEPYLVSIGNDCLFSGMVQFLTHDGSLHVFRKEIPNAFIYKRVVIGNNVFIGYSAIIMPGVTIGNNVIIGAGSLVNKDIPDNSVAVGIPARVIKNIEDYKTKMLPQLDLIDGFNKLKKKEYLRAKYNLDINSSS